MYATEFDDVTPFTVHSDDAPTFYITGNPSQTDPKTRRLEQEAAGMLGFDIVQGSNGAVNQVAQALADQAEQALLHMVSRDPARTPNFILFANPDYFLSATADTDLHAVNRCSELLHRKPGFRLEPRRFPGGHHEDMAR